MTVHDLWYMDERDPVTKKKTGNRVPSSRHGRGKRWRVDWPDPNKPGKTLSKSFDKKTGPAGAETFDNQVNADISRGQYIDPKAGQVTVAEYAEQWRAAQAWDGSTADGVERFFRLHLLPELGGRRMIEVKRTVMQGWVKKTSAGMAASSFGTGWIYVKAMFTDAVDDDVIGKNPCGEGRRSRRKMSIPSPEKRSYFIPTPRQVHLLAESLAAIRPTWKPVPYIAAGCGSRPGETLGLELEHVDFLRRKLHIKQQLKYTKERGVHIAKVKTQLSNRDVDLPNGVAESLSEHVAGLKVIKPVRLWDWTNERKPVERDVYLLFTTPERAGPAELSPTALRTRRHRLHKASDHTLCLPQSCPLAGDAAEVKPRGYFGGGPVYGDLWSDVWRDAVAAAGLPDDFGLHGLRHYFATLLIHKGKSVKTVQLALGHSNPMITLNTYTHEWPEVQDRTRDIVDAALFGSDDISVTGVDNAGG